MKEHWKNEPDEHDYPAAFDYLSLLIRPVRAEQIVQELKSAKLTTRKAKDLLRASRLELLPEDNKHVAKDLAKVKENKKLSPVLLVRADPLVIADGYHRICASYHLDENAEIPCQIV